MGLKNTVPRRWYWDLGSSNGSPKHFPTKVVLGFGWFAKGPNKGSLNRKFDPSPKEALPPLKFV